MSNIFLVKNLYNYEKVIPPPVNLKTGMTTVYITDSDYNCEIAKSLGWDIVKKTDLFLNTVDKFKRRVHVGFINTFPHKIVPEILDFKLTFVCDSNIVSLFNGYNKFMDSCSEDNALFVTSGYYSGQRDNMIEECKASLYGRWSYNQEGILKSTQDYIDILNFKKINPLSLSVVSGKFLGWNFNHNKYEELSNFLYKEYCRSLQGNIILTYMSGLFKESIYNHVEKDYSGIILNPHNFVA
jgi:hypothetical protein